MHHAPEQAQIRANGVWVRQLRREQVGAGDRALEAMGRRERCGAGALCGAVVSGVVRARYRPGLSLFLQRSGRAAAPRGVGDHAQLQSESIFLRRRALVPNARVIMRSRGRWQKTDELLLLRSSTIVLPARGAMEPQSTRRDRWTYLRRLATDRGREIGSQGFAARPLRQRRSIKPNGCRRLRRRRRKSSGNRQRTASSSEVSETPTFI